MYKNFFKRILDIIIAAVGLIFLSPIILILFLILCFTNNFKPFFFHKRPGLNEKVFMLVKFKSMTDKKDKNGELLPYKERVTKIGQFIRKYSLDEIPQLLNVVKGDMSIIGPRPLLISYLPLYNETQKKRHLVKPGISGWAQVNGRNAISWEKKFELDYWYVNNISLKTDIRIIFLTLKKVVLKKDVNLSPELNMKAFTGTTKK
ncbi:sugar transferase [Algibacter sp. AS12]|uniref:sugar transferase n=1 Tax=Algibacter sp. AS12 TaxID=3135773 RepID=UPI00398B2A4B